jgi:hypothetical protein
MWVSGSGWESMGSRVYGSRRSYVKAACMFTCNKKLKIRFRHLMLFLHELREGGGALVDGFPF